MLELRQGPSKSSSPDQLLKSSSPDQWLTVSCLILPRTWRSAAASETTGLELSARRSLKCIFSPCQQNSDGETASCVGPLAAVAGAFIAA
jgi:hypothetical protein